MQPIRLKPSIATDYADRLGKVLATFDWSRIDPLIDALQEARAQDLQVFLCGNGGSAGNAMHLANDYLYGINQNGHGALRVIALPANSAVMTCLANDVSYAEVFSEQLRSLARKDDILITLSGSGNSPNILSALKTADELKMQSFAILGFDGGEALVLADHPIHFAVQDMQISEDLQMIVGHIVMKALRDAATGTGSGRIRG